MEHAGWLSVLPPLLAIGLAIRLQASHAIAPLGALARLVAGR